jgi:hypothetical protein
VKAPFYAPGISSAGLEIVEAAVTSILELDEFASPEKAAIKTIEDRCYATSGMEVLTRFSRARGR